MSEVTLRRIEGRGMILVRAGFVRDTARNALRKITGADHPEALCLSFNESTTVAWMAPDEVLVLLPEEEAKQRVKDIAKALSRQHALVQNVSDARAIFRLNGPGARGVLARLTPADVSASAFGPGAFRRTRLAQVPGGIWMRDDLAIGVMCFRSVSDYVEGILENAVASEQRS